MGFGVMIGELDALYIVIGLLVIVFGPGGAAAVGVMFGLRRTNKAIETLGERVDRAFEGIRDEINALVRRQEKTEERLAETVDRVAYLEGRTTGGR